MTTKNSIVAAALSAALEDLSATVSTGDQVSESSPEQIQALANDEGPQAQLLGEVSERVALENQFGDEAVENTVNQSEVLVGEFEDAVDAVAALESIADMLAGTCLTKTATLASNAGFSTALQHTLRAVRVPTKTLTYGLESGEDAASADPSSTAGNMAKWALDKAGSIKKSLGEAGKRILEAVIAFFKRVLGSNQQIAKRCQALNEKIKGLDLDSVEITSEELIAAIKPVSDNPNRDFIEFFKYIEQALRNTFGTQLVRYAEGAAQSVEKGDTGRESVVEFLNYTALRLFPVDAGEQDGQKRRETPQFIGGYKLWVSHNLNELNAAGDEVPLVRLRAGAEKNEDLKLPAKVQGLSRVDAGYALGLIGTLTGSLNDLEKSARNTVAKLESTLTDKANEDGVKNLTAALNSVLGMVLPLIVQTALVNANRFLSYAEASVKLAEGAKPATGE